MARQPMRRREPSARASRMRIGDISSTIPARFAIVVFAVLVAIFTVLFSLPVATTSGPPAPFVDALFTAVSVICVTGLSTVDMATYWSPFGPRARLRRGRDRRDRRADPGVDPRTDHQPPARPPAEAARGRRREPAPHPSRTRSREGQAVRLGETGSLLVTVAISVLVIEAIVAVLLFPRMLLQGVDPWTAAWQSVYTAAMAFTNTGFLPTSDGLAPVRARRLVSHRADDRGHLRRDRLPGDLRAPPQPAASARAGRCT